MVENILRRRILPVWVTLLLSKWEVVAGIINNFHAQRGKNPICTDIQKKHLKLYKSSLLYIQKLSENLAQNGCTFACILIEKMGLKMTTKRNTSLSKRYVCHSHGSFVLIQILGFRSGLGSQVLHDLI